MDHLQHLKRVSTFLYHGMTNKRKLVAAQKTCLKRHSDMLNVWQDTKLYGIWSECPLYHIVLHGASARQTPSLSLPTAN